MTLGRVAFAALVCALSFVPARAETVQVVIGKLVSGRVVLKKAGAVDYFCKYHPNMKGRVIVTP